MLSHPNQIESVPLSGFGPTLQESGAESFMPESFKWFSGKPDAKTVSSLRSPQVEDHESQEAMKHNGGEAVEAIKKVVGTKLRESASEDADAREPTPEREEQLCRPEESQKS